MKISDAISLGRTLVEPNDGCYWLRDGKGCACGMAMAAMGRTWGLSYDFYRLWPKAAPRFAGEISVKYREVVAGRMTMDQLIDWVRAHEPSDVQDAAPSEVPSINEKEHIYA